MKTRFVVVAIVVSSALPSLAARRAVIPVAGATAGAFGAQFKTEVQLHNRSAQSMSGRLVLHSAGHAASPADPVVTYSLEPHETFVISDFAAAFGRTGIGSVDLIPDGSGIPVTVTRAYDDKGEEGTTGASIPLVHASEAAGAGETLALIAPSDRSRFRFNIGVRSLGEGATVRFHIYSPAGVLLHSSSASYSADFFIQQGAEALLGIALTGSESIEVEVVSGHAVVYGTTTDNVTNDPSIQIASKVEPIAP